MKVIRFKRIGKTNWEIAFDQEDLNRKLDGDMAEVHTFGRTRFFTKWWLKTRAVGKSANMDVYEFYCPWYFKPLDIMYDLIFGKVKLEKIQPNTTDTLV